MKKERPVQVSERFSGADAPEKFLLCYLEALFPLIEGRHDSRECREKLERFRLSYPDASRLTDMLDEFYRVKFGELDP